MTLAGQKRKRGQASAKHPYLAGNFAPIQQVTPLTPCTYEGRIPDELAGGEYVRNGGNPVQNEDLGRDAHWFDGDGMLSGVAFKKDDAGIVQPEFVNQYVLTDVYLSTISSTKLKTPILPSIATLVNPFASFFWITLRVFRTLLLVLLSFLPGSKQAIKKISVANTSIWYHDGRALAGCESGPLMRINLPGLDTVGWYDGRSAENEPEEEKSMDEQTIGGEGLLGFMREWTTAHPKVDPITKEMLLFHSSFAPPYVQYSVIPEQQSRKEAEAGALGTPPRKQVNLPVPGVTSAKMMHDFGVSPTHSVIMDLPLSLDPLNMMKNKPVVEYDPKKSSRFGVFPRHNPSKVHWFETKACCIFHTVNTWDDVDAAGNVTSVHMLACRLTTGSTVFSAGNIVGPTARRESSESKPMPFLSKYEDDYASARSSLEKEPLVSITSDLESAPTATTTSTSLIPTPSSRPPTPYPRDDPFALPEEIWEEWTDSDQDQCRLYHLNFCLSSKTITSQYALCRIPFEFPSVSPHVEMQAARYVYGCSTSSASFGAALGKSAKIDVLVKIDVQTLIAKGEEMVRKGEIVKESDCVDKRSLAQVLDSRDEKDAIKAFQMPHGWFVQEPRFVPALGEGKKEDEGWLLFYAFDEEQLTEEGEVPDDSDEQMRARSELWIVDAANMREVVGRVMLPQRVPYGLHGSWFDEEMIKGQRGVEKFRTRDEALSGTQQGGIWGVVRGKMEGWLA